MGAKGDDARVKNDELADEVVGMLAEREWSLGTVECGVDGLMSRTIFDTDEGPMILGDSLVLKDVEQAAGILGLPRPQFKKVGIFSAKAARAAAREGRVFLGVNVCLVLWGPPPDQPVDPDQPAPVYLAAYAGKDVAACTYQPSVPGEHMQEGLVGLALNLIREVLP